MNHRIKFLSVSLLAAITAITFAAPPIELNTATDQQKADIRAALVLPKLSGSVTVTFANNTQQQFIPTADTDAARGVALAAAFAAAVAGSTIDCSPGNYYVAKSTSTIGGYTAQFAILDKMTIRLNGARLYKKSTATASAMFSTNGTNGIDDWAIIGPGTLDGSYAANADTAARGSATNEIGINYNASRRALISGIRIINFAGTGLQGNNATFSSGDAYGGSAMKTSTMKVSHCNIDLNKTGFANYSGNEYNVLTACSFNKNLTGVDIYAGNTKFIGCEISGNTNYGLIIRNGGNDGHGCFSGGWITHNAGFAVYAEASMDNGFLFSDTTLGGDSSTTNKIESAGGGLTFTGCYIESPIYSGSTPTGINTISNSFIAGSYTTVTDLSSAERLKWRFKHNHTLTGPWTQNDLQVFIFANDAAAAAGGLVVGDAYQVTGTGVVAVKQ